MSKSDAELLQAWTEGDSVSGARLFDRHYHPLYRFFINKVGGLGEVEDLVQRTFMACVEVRERYRGEGSFRSFLFGIARNTWLHHLRARQHDKLEPLSASLADRGLGATTVMHLRREQQLLLSALRRIGLDSQAVLEMTYWEQMPAHEIAAVFGVSEGSIRASLRKAKLELRGAMEGLARSPKELDSTVDGLEDWAEGLRDYWEQSSGGAV